eukprot:scaffold2933_cov245-Pinguiococcus_pyrenoidosus.AAC.4
MGGPVEERRTATTLLSIVEEREVHANVVYARVHDEDGDEDDVENPRKRKAAQCCKPSRHHFILVCFLLFNSMATEALPLFLHQLLPGYLALLLSVSLVLVFGEIIPSAIFTGPNQLRNVAIMAPFVKVLLCTLSPLAYPI